MKMVKNVFNQKSLVAIEGKIGLEITVHSLKIGVEKERSK